MKESLQGLLSTAKRLNDLKGYPEDYLRQVAEAFMDAKEENPELKVLNGIRFEK